MRCIVALGFVIAPFWKQCLLEGIDDLDMTMRSKGRIDACVADRLAREPWPVPPQGERPF